MTTLYWLCATLFLAGLNLTLWLGVFVPETAPSLPLLLAGGLAVELAILAGAWFLLRGRRANSTGKPALLLTASGVLFAAALLVPALWLRAQGGKSLRKHAQRDEPAQVRALITLGVPVDSRGPQGETPLMYAAAGGSPDSLEILLNRGADVNAQDRLGRNALAYAWAVAHSECAHILMSRGAR